MNIVKIGAIAIVVIVVVVIIAILWMVSRGNNNSRSASVSSSEREQSFSSSGSSNGSHFPVRSARGQSKYTVTKGQLVGDGAGEVRNPAPQVQAQQQEFPRHAAQAGNKMEEHRFMAHNPKPTAEKESRVEVKADSARTVMVGRLADLFSVKRSIEEEFGVSEEEMEKMVAAHRKKSEYRERRLPVNQHFNLDDYKDSKKVIRESANAGATFKGSKRGAITGDVYKTYGKNAVRARNASNADVMSMSVEADAHEAHLAKVRERRATGHLEVRN